MRKLTATSLVLALGLGISACSSTADVPKPVVTTAKEPVVSEETFAAIADATKSALANGDSKKDAKLLNGRVSGPLLARRTAEYALAKALDDFEMDPIVIDPSSVPIASGVGFPRTVMTVAGPQGGENLTTLSVWKQDYARSNFKLWAEAEIFPGTDVPALKSTSNDAVGTAKLDAKDYVTDPSKVMAAYVEYSKKREMGDVKFTKDDPLFTQIGEQQKTLSNALGDLGTVVTAYSAATTVPASVNTEDGGLIMLVPMDYSLTFDVKTDGATVRIGDAIGALADDSGKVEVTDLLTARYQTTVAFYVPPAGAADTTVEVIASSVPVLVKVDHEGADEEDNEG